MSAQPTLWNALVRGWRGLCPKCGNGRMFRAFLKVAERCPECSEDLSHHRADDMPAYLVILISGHISVLAMVAVDRAYNAPTWLLLSIGLPLCMIFSLLILQPLKGTVVALQWSMGLHGFSESKKHRES